MDLEEINRDSESIKKVLVELIDVWALPYSVAWDVDPVLLARNKELLMQGLQALLKRVAPRKTKL